jgi:hypothetical protein
MITFDPDFEALKLMTRIQWMINFEAIASVGNDEDAIAIPRTARLLAG